METELFDSRFVHFMWDDSLEGRRCFMANSIDLLVCWVEACNEEHRHAVRRNNGVCLGAGDYPFTCDVEEGSCGRYSRFAYYDPRYDERRKVLLERREHGVERG